MDSDGIDRKHFVLVHGACHGAWCWYKLKPRLESAGHKVTAIDLAASGINMKKIEDVDTFEEYSEPLLELMATLPSNEKVILVGHSLGGLNIALAMDKFPQKVAVGVFLTAFAPDTQHHPSYVFEKFIERTPSAAWWLDTKFGPCGNKTSMFFGPNFLSNKFYQLSSIEEKFSDVINWLKANATKIENSASDAGAAFSAKKLLPEVINKEKKSFGEKTRSTPLSTATNFTSPWSPGLFSNNQSIFGFGSQSSAISNQSLSPSNQSLAPPNHNASDDVDGGLRL